jgi:hypothetical protein
MVKNARLRSRELIHGNADRTVPIAASGLRLALADLQAPIAAKQLRPKFMTDDVRRVGPPSCGPPALGRTCRSESPRRWLAASLPRCPSSQFDPLLQILINTIVLKMTVRMAAYVSKRECQRSPLAFTLI